ncbi:MAG: DUF4010 domain-containing protein [bacterium]
MMTFPFEWTLGLRFLVALAMGFLIGLERETGRKEHAPFFFGGVRTFPIVSLFGFACAWFFANGMPWLLPAGLMAVTALTVVAYIQKIKMGRFGATSEVSVLVTYMIGVLSLLADVRLPIALGVVNTILLSEKSALESYVARLNRNEFLATLKFMLLALVIYPALPNAEFTPYHLNPARIWQIVVLVSAIGFGGYILSKKLGARLGLPISGLLGGIASSTAVSVATGRLAREVPVYAGAALQASLLASSVMYVRLLVLIAVFGGGFSLNLDWRMEALCLVGLLLALTVRKGTMAGNAPGELTSIQNPVEIRVAVGFGLMFVLIKVGVALAKEYFGQAGVLGLGILSGVVDVDPFVLSLVQGTFSGRLMLQALLLAVMVNTLAKGIYFTVLSRGSRFQPMWRYIVWAACHVPLMWV